MKTVHALTFAVALASTFLSIPASAVEVCDKSCVGPLCAKGGQSFIERYAMSISAISRLLSASPSERLSDLSFHRSQ